MLAATVKGGPHVTALNEAAEAAGLVRGETLADARVKIASLQMRAADPEADNVALRRLALWATRYTPTASLWRREAWNADAGIDGFFLDIEGAAHLFGGEQALIADLAARLSRFGLPARLAVAGTPGAAWALSRFHTAPLCVLPAGREAEALCTLPVEALRLDAGTCVTLRRLGFKTIGGIMEKPRAPFAARFAAELLLRLDQALGRSDEPLVPVAPPPLYHGLHYWLDPVTHRQAIIARIERVMGTLVPLLTRDGVGARCLTLRLYGVDGTVRSLAIGLTQPSRDPVHVARLFDLKLEALDVLDETGFGFEALDLAVSTAEPMPARQTELVASADHDRAERCAALIDALRQRLGPHHVKRIEPVASHLPERAEAQMPFTRQAGSGAAAQTAIWVEPELLSGPRPLLLLPQAEPTEVTALVPDGPPRRFCWRGVTYDVRGAQGPERIAAEWWRKPQAEAPQKKPEPTRDYYLVEDADGRRFWLYREGLYERETTAARWFVHGLFA